MWYLTSDQLPRVMYIGGQYKEVTVGRSSDDQANCFVIPDDPSISRKHAILTNIDNTLVLQDLGSRYGTYVNTDDKIESNIKIKLNENDVVKFGKMGSVWTVNSKPFITCTSTLKGENLHNLKQCLNNLSGSLLNEWDDTCMFLTMPAITLTMKVVLALVQGAHIVTVDFWNNCLEAIKSQVKLPDPSKFTPQIIESTLNKQVVSFLPNFKRQELFSGKKFVFFSKRQFEMYKGVLTKASAVPLLLSESKMTKSMLCQEEIIVIQCNMSASTQESQSQNKSIQDIVSYMKSKGKRVVTDVEIGLAVLYCSTNKYCNPDFDFPSEVIKQSNQISDGATVLAQESQEPMHENICKKENVIIDESLNSTISSKRKLSNGDDGFLESSNKKFAAVGVHRICTSSGNKRKVDDTNNGIDSNPSKKRASNLDAFADDDGFNFVEIDSNKPQEENSVKRLNLVKPQKRKIENEEEDLFQFIQDKQKESTKQSIFSAKNIKTEISSDFEKRKVCSETEVDISALRGAKLEELMKNNEKVMKNEEEYMNRHIKEELNDKMYNLSLGTTIVKVRNDLVVKKEPIVMEEPSNHMKNFKKFKKVWPVKMNITIIPKSSTSELESTKFLGTNSISEHSEDKNESQSY